MITRTETHAAARTGGVGNLSRLVVFRRPLRQIARLAFELTAERVERRETHRTSLLGLQHGEVRDRDADPIRELGQRETTIEKH